MPSTAAGEIRVLHVDDEPSFGDLTATFLEQESTQFDIETTTSADEGMAIIADDPPDCVVSDYNMPGKNGLEFLEAVREVYPDLPFILFTGKGSEQVASDAIAADVTDYLQKGSGTGQYELLANRIRNAVQARRDAQRAGRQQELMRLTELAGDTGGWEVDLEEGTTRLTDGTRRLIGLPEDEDGGLSLEEATAMYHPEDRPDVRRALNRAVETGEQREGTYRLETVDGDERTLNVTITPLEEDGKVTKLRGAIHDITEQQKRKQELEAERRFIQQALDTLEDLFYVLDRDGSLRRWNEQVSAVTGYSDAELAEMSGTDLFPEDERETITDAIETTLAGETTTVKADIRSTDGRRIPYEFRAQRLTDGDGETTGLVGIGRDLTEQRRRQRRFQALVEESNDVISVVDADGHLRYQSPSVERVLGHRAGEMVGDIAWEYVHPDDRERVVESFGAWIASPDETSRRVEYRARHADGSWRWMEAQGSEQLDSPVLDGYVITSRDITARKERERKLEQTQALMSNMEELAGVGAWEYSPETEQLVMTDGAYRIFGHEPDTSLTLDETFGYFHQEDRERLTDRFEDCVERGESYNLELRFSTVQGTQRWMTANGERVDGETGTVRGYIQDITDQKQYERRLEAQSERLEEFVGIVSNDLQDPLTVAESRLELVKGECESDHLARAADAVDRSQALVGDLLTLAREDREVRLTGSVDPAKLDPAMSGERED